MKKYLIYLLVIIMLILPNKVAIASEYKEKDSYFDAEKTVSIKEEFDQMFEFNDDRFITLDGQVNKMFIEFSSQEDALKKIKYRCSELLSLIESYYNIGELSEENWQRYYSHLRSMIDDVGEKIGMTESNYEYRFLNAFFDIYENKYKNDKVIQYSSMDLYSIVNDEGDKLMVCEVIAINLPYYSEFSKDYFEKNNYRSDFESNSYSNIGNNNNLDVMVAINVVPAVTYATAYATSPNTAEYYYFTNGDCANFVSQILEASGVNQEVYDSVHSGWWHKYNPNAWLTKHTHSRSWTMADTFCRYMGIILTTTSHYSFSTNVFKGSIIAQDVSDDGDWDHVGFVTAADNYVGSYGYYDYKVAQHTTNYHLWTSNSGNHWEDLESNGGRYGRIRD